MNVVRALRRFSFGVRVERRATRKAECRLVTGRVSQKSKKIRKPVCRSLHFNLELRYGLELRDTNRCVL
jgi:hypothetical protein